MPPRATDRDGRLVGADAVGFFERSGLPRELLAKVWAAADPRRQGFLDFSAFCKALELMSLAQVRLLAAAGHTAGRCGCCAAVWQAQK